MAFQRGRSLPQWLYLEIYASFITKMKLYLKFHTHLEGKFLSPRYQHPNTKIIPYHTGSPAKHQPRYQFYAYLPFVTQIARVRFEEYCSRLYMLSGVYDLSIRHDGRVV